MRVIRLAAVAAGLWLAAGSAGAATTITFDELGHDSGFQATPWQFDEGEFTVTTPQIDGWIAGAWGATDPGNPGDGAALAWRNTFFTVGRFDGQLFDVLSLDLADFFNVGTDGLVLIYGSDPHGEKAFTSYQFDGTTGLHHLDLTGFTNLNGLVITTQLSAAGAQVDNIVLDNVHVGPAIVPEPSTWALMILGFGAVGSTLRGARRRTA